MRTDSRFDSFIGRVVGVNYALGFSVRVFSSFEPPPPVSVATELVANLLRRGLLGFTPREKVE